MSLNSTQKQNWSQLTDFIDLLKEYKDDEGNISMPKEKLLELAHIGFTKIYKTKQSGKQHAKSTRVTQSPRKNPSLIPYRYEKLTEKNRIAGWTGYYKDCYVSTSRHARYRENGTIWVTQSLQEAITKAEEKGLTAVVEVKKGYECRKGNKLYKNPRNNWGLGMASYVRGEIKMNQEGDQSVGNLREYISPYETPKSLETTVESKQSCDEPISDSFNKKEYESSYNFEETLENRIGLEVIGDAPQYPLYIDYLEKTSEKKNKFSVDIIGNAPSFKYYNSQM